MKENIQDNIQLGQCINLVYGRRHWNLKNEYDKIEFKNQVYLLFNVIDELRNEMKKDFDPRS